MKTLLILHNITRNLTIPHLIASPQPSTSAPSLSIQATALMSYNKPTNNQLLFSQFNSRLFPSAQSKIEFNTGISKILKKHRIITSSPGLTCGVYANPRHYLDPDGEVRIDGDDDNNIATSIDSHTALNTPYPHHGGLIFSGATGYNSLEAMDKLKPENTMMIGSVTKFTTAVLIGRLIETGTMTLLDLERPIIDFFGVGLSAAWENNKVNNYWLAQIHAVKEMIGVGPNGTPKAVLDPLIVSYIDKYSTPFFGMLNGEGVNNNTLAATFSSLLPDSFKTITLTSLLTHTAGIRDYDLAAQEDHCQISYPNVFLASHQFIYDPLLPNTSQPQSNHKITPKRGYKYTTFGYCLVELVVECILFNHNSRPTTPHKTIQHPTPLIKPPSHSFQSIIEQYIKKPLVLGSYWHEMVPGGNGNALNNIHHNFALTSYSSSRATEYTRIIFPRQPILRQSSGGNNNSNAVDVNTPVISTLSPSQSPSQRKKDEKPEATILERLSPEVIQAFQTQLRQLSIIGPNPATISPSPLPLGQSTQTITPPQQGQNGTQSSPTVPQQSFNTNKTLSHVITNKSNVGGCIVADVRALALFGGALTHSYEPSVYQSVPFISRKWLEFMYEYHYSRASHTPSTLHPIQPHLYPSHFAYGLGCINLFHTAPMNSVSAQSAATGNHHNVIAGQLVPHNTHHHTLTPPVIYHTGQGVGSSAALMCCLADGIVVALLSNVGVIDLKDCAADIASFVKTFITTQLFALHNNHDIHELFAPSPPPHSLQHKL